MNETKISNIEARLSKLNLAQPSTVLDNTISQLATESRLRKTEFRNRHFGWPSLVAVALAAMVSGILVGYQFHNNQQSIATTSSLNDSATLTQTAAVYPSHGDQVTNADLNVFQLMHGHSQQEEFMNCRACHDPEAPLEFPSPHSVHKTVQECTSCHLIGAKELPLFEGKLDCAANVKGKLNDCKVCHTSLDNPG